VRLALQVTEAYVEAATAETRRRRLVQVTRVFRKADSSMTKRQSEGDASGYAARRIRLERARYEQRLAAARLDVRNARRQLALLTRPDGASLMATESLPSSMPPSIPEQTALRTALRQRPELRRWQSAVAAQKAARRAARREARPDPSVTAGYKRQSNGFRGPFSASAFPFLCLIVTRAPPRPKPNGSTWPKRNRPSPAARFAMRYAGPTRRTRLRVARSSSSETTCCEARATCSASHKPATTKGKCPSSNSSTRRTRIATLASLASTSRRIFGAGIFDCSERWDSRSTCRNPAFHSELLSNHEHFVP
jgi:Outer membrane protein